MSNNVTDDAIRDAVNALANAVALLAVRTASVIGTDDADRLIGLANDALAAVADE